MWRLHLAAMPPRSVTVTPSLPVSVTDSPLRPCAPASMTVSVISPGRVKCEVQRVKPARPGKRIRGCGSPSTPSRPDARPPRNGNHGF